MTKLSNMTDQEKYQHQLLLNRERQRKHYEKNKSKILEKKKTQREAKCNECETANESEVIPANANILQKFKAKMEVSKIERSEVSIRKHAERLKDFMKITDCAELEKCLKSPKKIIDSLNNAESNRGKVYAVNSKKSYMESVLVAINELELKIPPATVKKYQIYRDSMDITSRNDSSVKKTTEPVERFDTYLKNVEKYFGESSKQYLLSRVYDEAPLRDDFHRLIIISTEREASDPKTNYIQIPRSGNAKVIIQEYKTSKKYNTIKILLTPKLTDLIRKYMKAENITYGDGLFGMAKSLSDFASKMNKSLGYKGGVTLFRQMKISTELDKGGIFDAKLRRDLSDKMGHAIVTQLSYIRNLIPS